MCLLIVKYTAHIFIVESYYRHSMRTEDRSTTRRTNCMVDRMEDKKSAEDVRSKYNIYVQRWCVSTPCVNQVVFVPSYCTMIVLSASFHARLFRTTQNQQVILQNPRNCFPHFSFLHTTTFQPNIHVYRRLSSTGKKRKHR
jgi:hypothetical protein